MSLAGSFERFWYDQLCDGANTEDRPKAEQAYYAGAEATYKAWNDQHSPNDCAAEMKKLRAEIDHFRSHK